MAGPLDVPGPDLHYEAILLAQGARTIAGVDEVGRGSWAGPVVAAAVVVPLEYPAAVAELSAVRDSKLLTPSEREALFGVILVVAAHIGVGFASHHVIDAIGLAAANRRAMLRSIHALRVQPDAVVVDAVRLRDGPGLHLFLPKADRLSLSVACASIVAKVVRDRWMARCESRYPGYGFAEHKGYGTPSHREVLGRLGPCPLHRRSFEPIAALVW